MHQQPAFPPPDPPDGFATKMVGFTTDGNPTCTTTVTAGAILSGIKPSLHGGCDGLSHSEAKLHSGGVGDNDSRSRRNLQAGSTTFSGGD